MIRKHAATLLVATLGLAGVLLVLFAWGLPPFSASAPETENAAIRGRVTTVAPQLAGYLAAVEATDFQTVKKGDVIARLDDRSQTQRLAQARAQLAGAKAALAIAEQAVHAARSGATAREAALEAARSAQANARTAAGRATALKKRGVASDSVAEQTDLALQQADAGVAQAEAAAEVAREDITSATVAIDARRADIAAAEAAVALAEIDLMNTVIRAPDDGRLGQVAARVGQYVTPGTALAALVGPDIWVIANFKETGLHGLRLGQPVTFTVDAMRHRAFTGRVEAYSPATASEFSLIPANNATGNFTKVAQRVPVRISVDPGQEMHEYLVPGLSVVVHVDTSGVTPE